MATGDINPVYATSVTGSGSGSVGGLASSTDFTAGTFEYIVDVSAMSPIPSDIRHQGKHRVGSSPTNGTLIQMWLIPCEDGTNWPDVASGTAGAVTWTSAGVRDGVAKPAAIANVDSTTSNRDYPYDFSAAQVFGGTLPKKYAVFTSHNTGVTLDNASSGANHTFQYTAQYNHVA